jgi:primosomal protein N' (replication factor Y)
MHPSSAAGDDHGRAGGPCVQVYLLVDTRALDRPLDYLVPPELDGQVGPGALVACPLGSRRVVGVVVGSAAATHSGRVVALAGRVETDPIPAGLLELARWVARYYAAPGAACLRLVVPPGAEAALRRARDGGWRLAAPPRGPAPRLMVRRGPNAPAGTARQAEILAALPSTGATAAAELVRTASTTMDTLRRMAAAGLIELTSEIPAAGDVHGLGMPVPAAPQALTADQAAAVDRIARALAAGGPEALLLHGVTGSGKTEVYLRALDVVRAQGRGGIVLVPEISLTPQLLSRLRARLGPGVEVWHSNMTPAERARADARLRDGEADVVVGARSAVFAPVRDVGLIVVDEEHDASYKQDSTPRYDARQVAFRRARQAGALVLYGSATPRPETWHALERLQLRTRADGSHPPAVRVVDMRTQGPGPVSAPLARALRDAADRGQKAVLLLNRRGFALLSLCRSCGWIATCPACDVSLVHHREPARLACHHCGFERPVPTVCPRCGSSELMRGGMGTQGLEQALAKLVPTMRLVRLDASSTAARGSVAELLAEFARPGAAILLGTQMVAKGHDLPEVTVAAVLDADAGLRHPDFRAEERAFDLIVQTAGRAGRRGEDATVIVQAWEPASRAIQLAAQLAVETFLEGELERRREYRMPPFGHLVRMVVEGHEPTGVVAIARALAGAAADADAPVSVLGPAPLHRIRGRTRRAVLVRGDRVADARTAALAAVGVVREAAAAGDVRIVVDVDPQTT